MWSYAISTGQLVDALGEVVGHGYSGFGLRKNNPGSTAIPDHGPIPEGLWKIGTPYTDPHKGPVVMALTPDETTETFGRSAFLIHGDSINTPGSASHGCVVLPHDVRVAVSLSPDKLLYVKA